MNELTHFTSCNEYLFIDRFLFARLAGIIEQRCFDTPLKTAAVFIINTCDHERCVTKKVFTSNVLGERKVYIFPKQYYQGKGDILGS